MIEAMPEMPEDNIHSPVDSGFNDLQDEDDFEVMQTDEGLYEHYRFIIDPGQAPLRIDKFLFDRMQKVSRNKIQEAAQSGYVLVNGEAVKANYKVKPGNIITIAFPNPKEQRPGVVPEEIPLDIRYEDQDVMVIHKPAGMVVHPGVGNYSGTLVNALAFHLSRTDLPVKEGNQSDRPGLVHRIDKDTSGLLVIAKSERAMKSLSDQFFHHTVQRKYIALVWGEPEESEGTFDWYIGRNPNQRLQMMVFPEQDNGKRAVTHFKIIEPLYYVSLLECQLETGRTHQIRVHMQYAGHPLFNDQKYGGDRIVKGTVFTKYKQFVENTFQSMPRHALHAKSLGFIHPSTGEEMFFDSDIPEDFQRALDRWRAYHHSRKELS